jgi:CheY-like chemotaxis protein
MAQFNCVLLIDDDEISNYTNYQIIKNLDLSQTIETVYNGEKALNFIQFFAENHDNHAPELILLDLKMPVMDGFEFIEYLTRKHLDNIDDIKLIILSNYPINIQKKLKGKFGQIQFLEKPLTVEKLSNVLPSQVG